MKKYFTLVFIGFIFNLNAQIFTSEIHYDNIGTDVDEGIEVYIQNPQPSDLTQYSIVLYNGGDGQSYDTKDLSVFTFTATDAGGYYHYFYPTNGIQNGAPDGWALVGPSGVIEFLSYEGTFTATNGPANGMTSTSIVASEGSTTAAGTSIQNDGFGTWVTGLPESFGEESAINLPVTFSLINAAKKDHKVTVSWSTASELNNEYFSVERSSDNRNFVSIGKVQGKGTSHTTNNYGFDDESPIATTNYYRIRQVDYDGKSSLSTVVRVSMDKPISADVYPTSTSDRLTVSIDGNNGNAQLIGLNGKLIQSYSLIDGLNELSLIDLNPGLYIIRVNSGDQINTFKVIKN